MILRFMAVCNLKAITELEMSLDRQERVCGGGGHTGISGRGYVLSFYFFTWGQQEGYCNDIISANSGHYVRIVFLAMRTRA